MNAITLCSGGGLVDVALADLGLPIVAAVEIDPAIAGVYAANHGADHLRVEDLAATDFTTFPPHTVGWASPSCKNFSAAVPGALESADDGAVAAAISRYLRTCRPPVFVLENVRRYCKSAALLGIVHTLLALDYAVDIQVVNAADYGVPQTRARLILRARREGGMPPLPAPVPWMGWYAAIADILDTLPPSAFAPWQEARLPAELTESALIDGQNARTAERGGLNVRPVNMPAMVVPAGAHGLPRAFIVDCQNNGAADADGQRGLTVPHSQAPMFTVTGTQTKRQIRAFLLDGRDSDGQPRGVETPASTVQAYTTLAQAPRAWLARGRVVAMHPRALARFQSVPDTYWLPAQADLACAVIGNAVPPRLARALVAGLLERSTP